LAGSKAIDENRVQSHEEVGQKLDQWARSFGLTRR
jgi:hypothetical protein